MNDVSEHQIEKLYDTSANTGIIVEQTINGLLRVFVVANHAKAEKWALSDRISALNDYGIDSTIIAAAVQATTAQMLSNVDILSQKPSHSDFMRLFMKKHQPEQ
jgi:hypothetical protein